MEAVPAFIKFVGGIFLTLMFLGVATFIWYSLSDNATGATEEWGAMSKEFQDSKYLLYEDSSSSGSQVVNAIRKFKEQGDAGNIAIQVKTGKNVGGTWYYGQFSGDTITKGVTADLKKLKDPNAVEYVNPAGKFIGTVERDSNQVIRAVIFTQK